MRAIQNAGGHVGLTAREYPVAAAGSLRRGQVVQLSGGKVISAAAAQTAAILGVAAETHSGEADMLNARSNGESILVYDNPGLIFECPAPEVKAAASTATTVVAASGQLAAGLADDSLNGGVLELVRKAAGSTNTDVPGARREITDYTASTLTCTVADGGSACAGDVFRLYPPVGFAACGLGGSFFDKAVVSATGATAIKVVGRDMDRGMIRLMAAVHALGTEE